MRRATGTQFAASHSLKYLASEVAIRDTAGRPIVTTLDKGFYSRCGGDAAVQLGFPGTGGIMALAPSGEVCW